MVSEQKEAGTAAKVKLPVGLDQMGESLPATGYREHPVSAEAEQLLRHHLEPAPMIRPELPVKRASFDVLAFDRHGATICFEEEIHGIGSIGAIMKLQPEDLIGHDLDFDRHAAVFDDRLPAEGIGAVPLLSIDAKNSCGNFCWVDETNVLSLPAGPFYADHDIRDHEGVFERIAGVDLVARQPREPAWMKQHDLFEEIPAASAETVHQRIGAAARAALATHRRPLQIPVTVERLHNVFFGHMCAGHCFEE